MGKLNFCTPCGAIRVRDAKNLMEKMMKKKTLTANRCGFCNKTIAVRTTKCEVKQVMQESGVKRSAQQESGVKRKQESDSGTKRSARLATKKRRVYTVYGGGRADDVEDVDGDDDDLVDGDDDLVDVKIEDIDVDMEVEEEEDAGSLGNDDSDGDDVDMPDEVEQVESENEEKEETERDDKTSVNKGSGNRGRRFVEKTLLAQDVKELIVNPEEDNGIITCIFCQKEFDNLGKFVTHVASHTKNERITEAYVCSVCNKRFNRVPQLKTHMRDQHQVNVSNNKPMEVCTLCNKSSSRKNWLVKHMKTHSEKQEEKRFQCSHLYCAKEFKDRRDLARHEMIHTGVRPFVCDTCGRGFIRGEELRAHVRAHTGDYIYCTKCETFKTTKPRTLTRHMKDKHSGVKKERKPIEKNHICELCGGAYPSNSALRRHKVVHSDVKPFRCEEPGCSYSSAFKDAVKKHVDIVHLKIRPYKCQHCDKSFALGKTRQEHERTHTGEKPFPCRVCDRGFSRKAGLRFHMRLHTADYQFECELCGYRAIRHQTLKRHREIKHGNNGSDNMCVCDKCNMSFATPQSLKMHQRLHKDGAEVVEKKRFHCDQCDFSSDISRNVTKHIKRLHTDEATYECGHCRKKFRTRAKCEDHMKKFHLKYFSPGSYIHQEEHAKDDPQQSSSTKVASTGVASTEVASTEVASTEVASTEVASAEVASAEVASAVDIIRNAAEALFPEPAEGAAVNTVVAAAAESLIQEGTDATIVSIPITTSVSPTTVSTTDEEAAVLALTGLLPEGVQITQVLNEVTIPNTN